MGRAATAAVLNVKISTAPILLAVLAGCAQPPTQAPQVPAHAVSAVPAPVSIESAPPHPAPAEEPQVVEAMYFTTKPDGTIMGVPGPDDDLVEIVRHQNGKLWPGQPVSFDINTGNRLISEKKGMPPYVRHILAMTDENGVARVYLQPLPKN
jgi:hypothetical protein